MKWIVFLLALTTGPAFAQAVIVKSGDHADFTRLVFTFPNAAEWRLGRTENGYEMSRPERAEQYDLSDVFRLITKARLKSVWVDPKSGHLQLGVDCLCHAIPFEFSQNTVVIDIRDGKPPEGSAFELSVLTGETLPPLGHDKSEVVAAPRPNKPTYNWLNTVTEEPAPKPAVSTATLATQSSLQAESIGDEFRNAVIDQLAKGATEGVVDMIPQSQRAPSNIPQPRTPNADMPLTDEFEPILNVSVSDGTGSPALMEMGQVCPSEARLDLPGWGPADDPGMAIGAVRSAILGEFDQPSPEGLEMAVRTYLFLGFGAEARNLMNAFRQEKTPDPLVLGITYLVDGEMPPHQMFAGMQTCDSSAAFWALAAAPVTPPLLGLNGDAVARTFMGLPQHLKLTFAQDIVEKLLQNGDARNAEIIRNSLSRTAPEDAAIVPLLDAQMALQEGDPDKAEARLKTVDDVALADNALIALIEARFQMKLGVDEKDVIAVAAFAFENKGGVRAETFQRTLTHAQALGGKFDAAFETAGTNAALRQDVWMLLAEVGAPSDILWHATDGPPADTAQISAKTKAALARRLVDLGLPNAARSWLPDAPADQLLTAEVALANQDGRTALRTLAIEIPDAEPALLARAFQETGNYTQAASVLRDAGMPEEARRLDRWAGRWETPIIGTASLGATQEITAPAPDNQTPASDAWESLAALRTPLPDQNSLPQLEASRSHLDVSTSTRDRIDDLLKSVPRVTN